MSKNYILFHPDAATIYDRVKEEALKRNVSYSAFELILIPLSFISIIESDMFSFDLPLTNGHWEPSTLLVLDKDQYTELFDTILKH